MTARLTAFWSRLRGDSASSLRKVVFSLVIGFALSRITAEFLPPSTALVGAGAGLIVGAAAGFWLARERACPAWTLLPPVGYLLFPFPSQELALAAVVLSLVSLGVFWRRFDHPAAEIGVFAITLIGYTLTLSGGIQPADGGEFQLVITEWGVAHPPGYPLYTMLGGIFARLWPFADIPGAVNAFSAVTAALTLAVLARAIRRETASGWAGVIGAGVLGAAATFWTTATQASIRPMTALFAVLMLHAALDYRHSLQTGEDQQAGRALIGFGLAAGFGVTHHASLFFVGAVFAVGIITADPSLIRRVRQWGMTIGAALLGALPWLYLIARGSAGARLAPGNLTTWDGFWQHVLALGFQGDMFYYRAMPEVGERLRLAGQVFTFQWHTVILLLAVIAPVLLVWRDRWLAGTLGGAFAVHTLITATYRAPQTVEYMLPAYVCLAFAVGWAIGRLQQIEYRQTAAVFAAVAAVGVIWTGSPTWITLTHAQPDDSARAVLTAAPENATLLANWHQVTPLWVLDATSTPRPDVAIRYVAPAGAEPIIDTWARQVTEYTAEEPPLIFCTRYPEAFRGILYPFSAVGGCWQTGSATAPDTPPLTALEELTLFVDDVPETAHLDAQTAITLYWRFDEVPAAEDEIVTFVHLVDETGRVLAQDDRPLHAPGIAAGDALAVRYALFIPRHLALGDYQLLAGAYRRTPDGPVPIPDNDSNARVPVGAITLRPATLPPVTDHSLHTPFGEGIFLLGWDYDLSVLGRARLYLHWVAQPGGALAVTVGNDENTLGQTTSGDIPEPGYFTTAFDLPDTATTNGLWIRAAANEEPLIPRGVWGLPAGDAVYLPGPAAGDRYLPVGYGVITGMAVQRGGESADSAFITLTMRSTRAITQDISYQIVWGEAIRLDLSPVDGMIPSLKWGWGTTITERIAVDGAIPSDSAPTLTLYDAFTGATWPVLDPGFSDSSPQLPVSQ